MANRVRVDDASRHLVEDAFVRKNRAQSDPVGETRALVDAGISLRGPAKIVSAGQSGVDGVGVLAQALGARSLKRSPDATLAKLMLHDNKI